MAVEDLGRHIQFLAKWYKIAPKGSVWNTRVWVFLFFCFFISAREFQEAPSCEENCSKSALCHLFASALPSPPMTPSPCTFGLNSENSREAREWSVGQPACLIPWQTCGESKGHPWKHLWSLEPTMHSISPPRGQCPVRPPSPETPPSPPPQVSGPVWKSGVPPPVEFCSYSHPGSPKWWLFLLFIIFTECIYSLELEGGEWHSLELQGNRPAVSQGESS